MGMSVYLIHLKQQFITTDLRHPFTSYLLINLTVQLEDKDARTHMLVREFLLGGRAKANHYVRGKKDTPYFYLIGRRRMMTCRTLEEIMFLLIFEKYSWYQHQSMVLRTETFNLQEKGRCSCLFN